ncbi:hypothetical protein CBL_09965 [Carabus blaptoides fortunei]
MDSIRRILKFMWPLIMLVTTLAKRKNQHASPPDIMMYYNFKQSQVTCVAGTNTYGNAMTFTVSYKYSVDSVFQYMDRDGNIIEEMICDYDGNVDQQCNPKFTAIMRSGKDLTSPVTDERWNKFETQYTAGRIPTYSYMYPINETNFHISFSVRAWHNAQMLLCNSKGTTPKYSPAKCYWILIASNVYSEETFLRKCSDGIPDDYPDKNDNLCEIERVYKEKKLLSDKWTHFTVTRENGSTIKLWKSNYRTPILEYIDEEPIDIERLYFRGGDYANVDWKIHDYRYLVITKMNQYIQLGKQFSFSRSDSLCISLYVAVCSRCAMEIVIQSDRKTIATKIIQGKQGLFIPWQLAKIEMQVHSDITYTLHILATAEARVTDTFWAVDNIRRCYGDEIRVSSAQVAPQDINTVTCDSLQYPEWTFTASRDTNNSTALGCSDSRFTGTYCNISCKSVLSSDYCENNMICRPTKGERATTQCTCAANSGDPICSTECSYGYFGYNCQEKCGKCQGGTNRCDKISGECNLGCEEGYTPPHCINTTGPVLLVPPTVVSVSHANVTLRLDNITTLGDWRTDTFQIEYKLAGSARSWQQDTRRAERAENIEVTLSGLERETTYSIRVVLYAFNGDAYRLENVPYTNATTICEVDRVVNIKPYARHANITLHNNEEGCLITNYFVRLATDNKRLYFTENWEKISKLKPFTNYTIIIGNYLYPQYNYTKTFTTMEAVPSNVPELKALHTSDTTITVTWDVEHIEYLRQSMVFVKSQKFFDCPWNPKSDDYTNFLTNFITPGEHSEFRITDLHPYARYELLVYDQAVGTEMYGTFDTLSSNHVIDLELPHNVTVDSYSRNVIIKWIPPSCVTILGPLRYNVSITCVHDPWCDQVIPVTREFNAFSAYVSMDTLTPFTNYRLQLRATRNGTISQQYITVYFRTKEAAPPAVRSLKDYSRDNYFISLRWLAPYPPYGTPEYYDVVYCYISNRLRCDRYERVYPVRCSFWDEDGYMCFDIKYTQSYSDFKLFVAAKNTGIIAYGAYCNIVTRTHQSSPSVPLNFHATWNQNMLTLHWDCPDLPGGPLIYFRITLRQFETEISAKKGQNQEYKLEVDKLPLRKKYNYTIAQTMPDSTSYNITVCGVNMYNGTEVKMDVYTPPPTPVLAGDIVINREGTTASTISITIPGVQANATSRSSYVYVVVSEHNSNNITKRNAALQESSEKEEILQFAPGAENTWIAVEFQSRDSYSTFIIGSNSCTHSEHLNEDLINKPLTSAGTYDITIVLMNVYRDKRSYKDYKSLSSVHTASTNPSSPVGCFD